MFNNLLIFICCLLALFSAVTPSNAAFWIGGEIGPNFSQSFNEHDSVANPALGGGTIYNMNPETGIVTGLTLGYDFVNRGLLGANWPDWMKYVSFAIDLTYNKMNFRSKTVTVLSYYGTFTGLLPNIKGNNIGISFLFMGKYPLMVGNNYESGRLAPYIAVGPSIVLTSIDWSGANGSQGNSTDIGFVVESGIRFMVTPSFSADLAYRFRFVNPIYYVNFPNGGGKTKVNFDGVKNHMILFRLAYHF